MDAKITIDRWRSVYHVAADHPAPEDLRARLDRLAATEVTDACRRGLERLLDPDDASVWLIREIRVPMMMDATLQGSEQAAALWGENLALAIRRVVEEGPTGSNVIRFPDRAAYIAQWARDMALGSAWNQWYYSEFAGLRSLPPGVAIAEGILREGDGAKPILLQLQARKTLEPVLGALTEIDAQRLFAGAFPDDNDAPAVGTWVNRLLAVWNAVPLRGAFWRDALRLYAAASSEWPEASDTSLPQAVRRMLELRSVLRAVRPSLRREFLEQVGARQFARAHSLLAADGGAADTALLAWIAAASGGDPAWAELASAVIAPAAAAHSQESFISELGGVFLLAGSFLNLRVHEAVLAAAQTCEKPVRAAAILRRLLAARCLGQPRASLALADPAVACFAGAEERASLAEMAETAAAADAGAALRILHERLIERGDDPDAPRTLDYFAMGEAFPELQLDPERELAWSWIAAALLRDFARRLRGFANSSPDYLFQNFLAGTSAVRVSAERIDVTLPQSPLAIVLRMAGLYRPLTLPWREGVEICLLAPAD